MLYVILLGLIASVFPSLATAADFTITNECDVAVHLHARFGGGTGITLPILHPHGGRHVTPITPHAQHHVIFMRPNGHPDHMALGWSCEGGLNYFDLSQVDGHPFRDLGFKAIPDSRDPAHSCYATRCHPGQKGCPHVWEPGNQQHPTTCGIHNSIHVTLCRWKD